MIRDHAVARAENPPQSHLLARRLPPARQQVGGPLLLAQQEPKYFLTTLFLFAAALCPIVATYAPLVYTVPLWILGLLSALLAVWTADRRYQQILRK